MRISIIHTREICYYSGEFFLRRMEEALESIGCEVEYLELSHDDVIRAANIAKDRFKRLVKEVIRRL